MPVKESDSDNMYPTNGEYFTPKIPAEQADELEKEQSEVFNSLPIIQGLIERLDERIAFRDSIKAISVDIQENPELHQKACAVNEMLADALKEEKSILEAYVREYVPGQ